MYVYCLVWLDHWTEMIVDWAFGDSGEEELFLYSPTGATIMDRHLLWGDKKQENSDNLSNMTKQQAQKELKTERKKKHYVNNDSKCTMTCLQ